MTKTAVLVFLNIKTQQDQDYEEVKIVASLGGIYCLRDGIINNNLHETMT